MVSAAVLKNSTNSDQLETSSKASSKASSAKSEMTEKVKNQNSNTASRSSISRGLFGRKVESKEDQKIKAYIGKLREELSQARAPAVVPSAFQPPALNVRRVIDILTKIRMLLDVRVEKGDKSALPANYELGPTIVEVMRQHEQLSASRNPTVKPNDSSSLMEECTCILYFVSVLDPSFKKGVARLFKAMADFKSNVAIQRASCEAIRNVVQANPGALPRIAPSLGVILQSMAAHGANHKLIFKSMELLADLALEPVSKPLFVQKGGVGLLHVLTAMNRHSKDGSIQAAGCRCLANLSMGATAEVLQRLTPSLDVILRAMNRHTSLAHVQLYGCAALGHLATWHHAEIVHQGAVDAILPTMREMPLDGRLLEQCCIALRSILNAAKDAETKASYIDAIVVQQGIPTLLETLRQHPGNLAIQIQGIGILVACASMSIDNQELLLSEGGLDVLFRAMSTHDSNVDVAGGGMEFMKNFTRQSLDFQRAVFAKGGIGIVVQLMKIHQQAHMVQDPAFACLRNIAIHPENRATVVEQGGIPVMLNNMQIYISDAAIQAYGCDALGRLAQGSPSKKAGEPNGENSKSQELIVAHQGIDIGLGAMASHPNHPGVQDRAIFLLLSLSTLPDAVTKLKEKGALETIKQARIPQKEAAMERCEQLIQALEKSKGWFNSLRK